jgi:DNA repair protein RecO (recombination protein O)
MPLQTTEAIVIGGHVLGEADRIVSFFTRRFGKVRVVAKGARRLRSRFVGVLEPFTLGQLVFFERPNRTLHAINEFSVIDSLAPLKSDLDRLGRAAYLVELGGAAVEEAEPNEEIFLLLREALLSLAQRDDVRLLRAFEIRLLKLAGYLLELYRCLICRAALVGVERAVLSPSKGGLVCSRCQASVQEQVAVSAESIAFLRSVVIGDLGGSLAAVLSPPGERELQIALQACIAYFLGTRLRTIRFLSHMEQGA